MHRFLAIFALICTISVQFITGVENPNNLNTIEEVKVNSIEEHHRSKRSPYDPLIPALLLGKSAFLLGTVLGPQLLHRPYHHRRPRYYRVHHGGYGGGHGGYYHGGSSYGHGWGWK